MKFRGLSNLLDKVANSLESKGLLNEAFAVDVIANTVEAQDKEPLPVLVPTKVKRAMENAISKYNKTYSDQGWSSINKLIGDLRKIVPNIDTISTEYSKDDSGDPSSKRWVVLGGFEDDKGAKKAAWAQITGYLKDGDKYEIVSNSEVLAPKNVKGYKEEEYLRYLGLR